MRIFEDDDVLDFGDDEEIASEIKMAIGIFNGIPTVSLIDQDGRQLMIAAPVAFEISKAMQIGAATSIVHMMAQTGNPEALKVLDKLLKDIGELNESMFFSGKFTAPEMLDEVKRMMKSKDN